MTSTCPAPAAPTLAELLECHQHELMRLVWARARGLLRYETPEDLRQEINLHALQVADRFVYRGEREFLGWLARVAHQRIATRHRAVSAQRRNLGTVSALPAPSHHEEAHSGLLAREPEPAALAGRREEIALLAKVLGDLLPRDHDLLVWTAANMPVAEIAQRLGLSRDSTNRARLRAVGRLRAAFLALADGDGQTGGCPRAR